MDLLVLIICLVLFVPAVFFAVRGLLRDGDDDAALDGCDNIVARARRTGRSDLPGFLARFLNAKRARAVRAELPDTLDMIANSLTAGLTLPQAIVRNLEHFPPLAAEEFARVIYDTRLGYSVGGAFDNLAARLPFADIRTVAIASKIGVAHGGSLQDSYRMLSKLLREKMAFESELHAMTTEGRMQAIVMSCLPLAMALILSLIRWELMAPLFTTLYGWLTIGGLLVMQLLAFLWISKIVRIEV